MLQPNSEITGAMSYECGAQLECRKNYEIINYFACDTDQRFHVKVKCLNGGASFWVKLPLYRAKFQSNLWGMPGGVGEGDGSLCEWDSSSVQDSLSLLMDIFTSWC